MRILRGERHTRADAAPQGPSVEDAIDLELTRYEPQAFAAHAVPADPYVAWRAQRDARERAEAPPVRWVYRHEAAARRARDAAAAARH